MDIKLIEEAFNKYREVHGKLQDEFLQWREFTEKVAEEVEEKTKEIDGRVRLISGITAALSKLLEWKASDEDKYFEGVDEDGH